MSGPALFWIGEEDRVAESPEGRVLEPGPTLSRHLEKSLRAKPGDVFRFVDPDRPDLQFRGTVAALSPLRILLASESLPEAEESRGGRPFDLAVGLLKGESYEDLIEPAACLGVRRLVPLSADRSQARWSLDQFERKRLRFEAKVREASQLAGRPDRMRLLPPNTLSGLLESREGAFVLFFDEDPAAGSFQEALEAAEKSPSLLAVTGPEGGWSERERALFRTFETTKNGRRASLGSRILPGRLAPVVVAGVLSLWTDPEKRRTE